jgi:hypothetical protein
MPIVSEVAGDLLDAKEKFIAQQCNCLTVRSHGLSAVIATRFKWADPYSGRASVGGKRNCALPSARDAPGSVRVFSAPKDEKASFKVLCLFAQWAPGKPGVFAKYYPRIHDDTYENRFKWFKECLKELDDNEDIDSPVALPYQIGCGLAGGDWSRYAKALEDAKTEFVIYNLDLMRKRKREE